jgi:hypothetical protein
VIRCLRDNGLHPPQKAGCRAALPQHATLIAVDQNAGGHHPAIVWLIIGIYFQGIGPTIVGRQAAQVIG